MVTDEPMLDVSKDDACPEIVVLQDCSIRWSVDCTIWYDMGERFKAGDKFHDVNGTANNPCSYMAVDGDRKQTYYSRRAAVSFADMLEPWFPSGHQR